MRSWSGTVLRTSTFAVHFIFQFSVLFFGVRFFLVYRPHLLILVGGRWPHPTYVATIRIVSYIRYEFYYYWEIHFISSDSSILYCYKSRCPQDCAARLFGPNWQKRTFYRLSHLIIAVFQHDLIWIVGAKKVYKRARYPHPLASRPSSNSLQVPLTCPRGGVFKRIGWAAICTSPWEWKMS